MVDRPRIDGRRAVRPRLDRAVRIVAVLVVTACVAALVAMAARPDATEQRTAGMRVRHFYRADGTFDADGIIVPPLGAAHNAGSDLGVVRRALAAGAAVVEIDVAMMGSTLVAAHNVPMAYLGRAVFRGPTLQQAWNASGEASIMLDLKQTDTRFVDALARFVIRYPDRDVAVVSSNTAALDRLGELAPNVLRIRSLATAQSLADLLDELDDESATFEGVSVRASLLDRSTTARLLERGLLIAAWVVDDFAEAQDLARWGVDVITTDNLALLEALADPTGAGSDSSRQASGQSTVNRSAFADHRAKQVALVSGRD